MAIDPQAQLRAQFPDLTDEQRTAMLDNLTDEERAGLLDPDLVDGVGMVGDPQDEVDETEEVAAKPKPAAEAVKEQPEDDEVDEEDEELPAAAAAASQTTTTAGPTDAGDADEAIISRPRLPWRAPENAEQSLQQFDTDLESAAEQFENGDMSAREYQAKVNEISAKKVTLQGQINEANLAFNLNRAGWFETVTDFLTKNPLYKDNDRLHSMLDTEVKRLQEASDDPFDPKILISAKKAIEADIVALGGAKPTPTTPKPAPQTPRRQVAAREAPPPTLGSLPAADATETDTSGYAALDRLAAKSPEKFEAALAKMSAAERDAYLAAS